MGIFLNSVSSIFLHTYIKWESGSSKTKSGGSRPFSVIGMGSKNDFVDELQLSRFSNPGLAVKGRRKRQENTN